MLRKIAAPVVAADASVELPTLPNVRPLPALDYDEPTVKLLATDAATASAALEETRPGRAQRGRGMRLFVVGVALGAIAVSLGGGGDGTDSFHLLRAWGASALRSFEHRPLPPVDAPSTAAAAAFPKPCPLTDEDCAALMAPYLAVDPPATMPPPVATTPDVPTIDVTELPMVQDPPPPPPRPVHIARAAAPRKATPPNAAQSDDDDALMDVAPAALPHPEDALDPPPKAPPAKPPPLFDAPSGADTGGPVAAAAPVKT